MTSMLVKNLTMAWQSMRSSRSRSFLTMLGVIIAVAAVTSVVSIGHGIQAQVAKQADQYSKNVITIRPAAIGSTGLNALGQGSAYASLSDKDVTTVSKVSGVDTVVPLRVVAGEASADATFRGPVFAVSSDLPQVVNQDLAFGAFFTSKEDSNNLAVLGATAADRMFDQRVPLGRSFMIGGQQFIVAGVLEKFASTPFSSGANFNNAVFVSNSAGASLSPNTSSNYEILAKINSNTNMTSADRAITAALNKAHHGASDIAVLLPTELARDSTASFDLLAYLILAAAVITLLVSGIGIMNVMLVSVAERIHEIGIRKAVGATNRQILSQFITEAAMLCLVGSVMGALLTLFLSWLIHVFSSVTPVYDWKIAALTCLLACASGVLFGTLPAIKAARKDPITALRSGE